MYGKDKKLLHNDKSWTFLLWYEPKGLVVLFITFSDFIGVLSVDGFAVEMVSKEG